MSSPINIISSVRRSLRLQKCEPRIGPLSTSSEQNSVGFRSVNTTLGNQLKEANMETKSDLHEEETSNINKTSSILPSTEEQVNLCPEINQAQIHLLPDKAQGNDYKNTNDCKLNLLETHCMNNTIPMIVQKCSTQTDPVISDYSNLQSEQVNELKRKDRTEMVIVKNGTEKINTKDQIDELLMNISDSDNESNHNSFLDSMAEEGEEDTPSEGSNDIIEVGEEINTTESEFSSGSYENNSFIDDEDNYQLLSGEEFDISLEDCRKRKRIIQMSSGSDDSIVNVARKKKCIKKRKSRIIRFEDSSDDEDQQKSEFEVVGQSVDSASSVVRDKNSLQSENKNEENKELHANLITSTPNNSYQHENKKIVILENIRVQDNKELADTVNNILTSMCIEIQKGSSPNTNLQTRSCPKTTENKLDAKTCDLNKILHQGHQIRKKKKRSKKQNHHTAFQTVNKNYFKFNQSTETYNKKSKKKKRKVFSSKENTSSMENRKISWDNDEKIIKTTNNEWEIENVVIQPSNDNVKCKVLSQNQCKFNVKDFKGLMLFDKKRVRRMQFKLKTMF